MVGRKVLSPIFIVLVLLFLQSADVLAASGIGGFCNEHDDNDVTCDPGLVCAGRTNPHFAHICLPSSMSPGRTDIDSIWSSGRCYGSYIEHRTTGGAAWFADFEAQFTRSEWDVFDESVYTFCGVTMYHAEVYRSDVDPGWEGTGWDGPVAYAWKATDGTNYWFAYQNDDEYGNYGPQGDCASYSIPANALDYAICNVRPAEDGEPAGDPVREYACASANAGNGICCAAGKTCCTSDGHCSLGQYCGDDHYCTACDDECGEGSYGCTDGDTRWSCSRQGNCLKKMDTDCSPDKVCSEGTCVSAGAADGGSCTSDDDCAGENSYCRQKPTPSPQGPVERVCCMYPFDEPHCCNTDADCEPLQGNHVCDLDYHACSYSGAENYGPCSSDADCKSDNCHRKSGASTGICCKYESLYAKCCTSDDHCDSGDCNTNTKICVETPDLAELYETCHSNSECESRKCYIPSGTSTGICCDPAIDSGVCCTADAHCASLDCDGSTKRCQDEKKDDGESCSSDDECSSNNCNNGLCCQDGSYCCRSSGDCPGDYYCDQKEHICVVSEEPEPVEKKTLYQACSSHEDCGSDNCCGGKCQPDFITCCEDTVNCQEGWYCQPELKTCSPLADNGKSCSDNDECRSGNCIAQVCCESGKRCCKEVAHCPNGQECGPEHHCVDSDDEQACDYECCADTDCGSGQKCMNGECVKKDAMCIEACSTGDSGCNGETIKWTCKADDSGCPYMAEEACPDGEVCDGGFCGPLVLNLCGSTDFGDVVEIEESYNGIETKCLSPKANKVFYKVHVFRDTPFAIKARSFKKERSISIVIKDSELDIVGEKSSVSASSSSLQSELARGETYIIEIGNIDKGYLATFTFNTWSVEVSDGCGGPRSNDNRKIIVEPYFSGDCYGLGRDQWYLLMDSDSSYVPSGPRIISFRTFGTKERDIIYKMSIVDSNEDIICQSLQHDSDETCIFRWEGIAHGAELDWDSRGLDDISVEVRTEVCGDGECRTHETRANCCEDCGCDNGLCFEGNCVEQYCGNVVCEDDESYESCPRDCPRPPEVSPVPVRCTGRNLGVISETAEFCAKFDTKEVRYGFKARDTGIYKIAMFTLGTEYKINVAGCGRWVSDRIIPEYIEKRVRLERGQACEVVISKSSPFETYFELLVLSEHDRMPPDVVCGDGNCNPSECVNCPQDCSYFGDPGILKDSDSYEEHREYLIGLRSLKKPRRVCRDNNRCEPNLGENCYTSENDCACPYVLLSSGYYVKGTCDLSCSVSDERGCTGGTTCKANDMFTHVMKKSFESIGLIKDCKTVVNDIVKEEGVDEDDARKYLRAAFVNCMRGHYKALLDSIGAEQHDFFEFMCGSYGEFDQLARIHEYRDVLKTRCYEKHGRFTDQGEACIDAVERMSYFLSLSDKAAKHVGLASNVLPENAILEYAGFWSCVNEVLFGITRTWVQMVEGEQLDLDLHVVDSLGRHVGMNYETGEYEVQIPNARTSYDMEGGSEIIYVPYEIGYSTFVSAHDAHEEVEEYNLTAGMMLNDRVYESPTVSNRIVKGTVRSHEISYVESGLALDEGVDISKDTEGSTPINTWADLSTVDVDRVFAADVEGPAQPETVSGPSGKIQYPVHPGVIAAIVILALLIAVWRSRVTGAEIVTKVPHVIGEEEEEEDEEEVEEEDEEEDVKHETAPQDVEETIATEPIDADKPISSLHELRKTIEKDPDAGTEHIPILLDGLMSDDVQTIVDAAYALRWYSIRHPGSTNKAIPTLKRLLKNKDPSVREAALVVLSHIGGDDPESVITVVPATINLLKDDNADVRDEAVSALFSFGDKRPEIIKLAIGPLSQALSDTDRNIRASVAIALDVLAAKDPSLIEPAIPALKSALDDDFDLVRDSAKSALSHCPDD